MLSCTPLKYQGSLLIMKKAICLCMAIFFLGSLLSLPANAAGKSEFQCSATGIGFIKIEQNKRFWCAQVGGKPQWKDITNLKESSYSFSNKCAIDPFVPKVWIEFQNYQHKTGGCSTPLRFKKSFLPKVTPTSQLSGEEEFLEPGECKLPMPEYWTEGEARGTTINRNMNIQIVPFATPDYKANSNPQIDYKNYISFISESLKDMTDGPSNYTISVPEKYFKIPKSLASYDVGIKNPSGWGGEEPETNQRQLIKDILKVADPEIDFSAASRVWFLGPPNTTRNILNNWGGGGWLETAEKAIVGLYITDTPYSYSSKGWNPRGPFGDLHEMMHTTGTSIDQPKMNGWGNMSGAGMDFNVWDKWRANYILDTQVYCSIPTKSSNVWIRPSTISESVPKLLLIKLGPKRAIAIESIRASGFNFKIPKCQQGALIYEVDTAIYSQQNELGLKLIKDTKRDSKCGVTDTFQKGSTVKFDGVRITVVEAGDFGDVVKVEKLS